MPVATRKRGRPKGGKIKPPAPSTEAPHVGLATVAEAMAYLRVSKTTMHKLIGGEKPIIEPVRAGRTVRILWRKLREFAGDC